MATIKRRVLEALVEVLKPLLLPEVPGDDIIIGDPGADRQACWPHVQVRQVGPFTFESFEEDPLWTTTDQLAIQVGDLTGQIEIKLGATNAGQRDDLEDRVLNAFLEAHNQEGNGRPGVLVVQLDSFTIAGKAALASVPVAYVLQTETWQEELVFEKKRYSSLVVDVDMPAIVIREGIPDIDTLVLAITDDLTSADPALTDQLSVSEDGDVTQYP